MLAAAERMLAIGGGLVVAVDGAIRAEVPLPLGGVISDQPMGVLAGQITTCQRVLSDLGCVRENPLLSAQVVTFIAIPALRIPGAGTMGCSAEPAGPFDRGWGRIGRPMATTREKPVPIDQEILERLNRGILQRTGAYRTDDHIVLRSGRHTSEYVAKALVTTEPTFTEVP